VGPRLRFYLWLLAMTFVSALPFHLTVPISSGGTLDVEVARAVGSAIANTFVAGLYVLFIPASRRSNPRAYIPPVIICVLWFTMNAFYDLREPRQPDHPTIAAWLFNSF
jgi:hypothetical protein